MLRDTTIDNNWWYTECQATYNIRSIDSSNAIIQFTRICASLVGGNKRCAWGNNTGVKKQDVWKESGSKEIKKGGQEILIPLELRTNRGLSFHLWEKAGA